MVRIASSLITDFILSADITLTGYPHREMKKAAKVCSEYRAVSLCLWARWVP